MDDVVIDAGFDGLDDAVFLGFGADHDDGGGSVGGADFLDEFEAVHIGHFPVDEEHVEWSVVFDGLEGFEAVGGFGGLDLVQAGKDFFPDAAHGFGVVDEQYFHVRHLLSLGLQVWAGGHDARVWGRGRATWSRSA